MDDGLQIINGYEVNPPHSQPWVVGFADENKKGVFCGGTLINKNTAISAQHCFDSSEDRKEKVYAVLGLHNMKEPGSSV